MQAVVATGILINSHFCWYGSEPCTGPARLTVVPGVQPASNVSAQFATASSRRRAMRHRRLLQQRERQQLRDRVFETASTQPATALSDCLSHPGDFTTAERVQVVRDALGPIEARLRNPDSGAESFRDWLSQLYPILEQISNGDVRNGIELPADLAGRVEIVRSRCRAQCASDCALELNRLITAGSWRDAATRSIHFLDTFPPGALVDVEPLLGFVIEFGRRREAADLLRPWLLESSLDQWRSPIRLELGEIPVEVREPLNGLRLLAEVRHAVESRQPLDVPFVLEHARALQRSPELGDQAIRLRQSVSFRAFLDGDSAGALQLLPDGGHPGYYQAMLDDITALASGQGELMTWPARREIAQGASPAPSPLLIAPVRAAATESGPRNRDSGATAPPRRDFSVSDESDAPIWEQPAAIELPLRRQLEDTTRAWSSEAGIVALHQTTANALRYYDRRIQWFDEQQDIAEAKVAGDRCLADVRRIMGRALELHEEFLAKRLCLEGQSPREVVEAIQAEADEVFE